MPLRPTPDQYHITLQLAGRAARLPGASPVARLRVELVSRLAAEQTWPASVRLAQARRAVDWHALSLHLGRLRG